MSPGDDLPPTPPGPCPRCGSADVVEIVYGMVGPDQLDSYATWVRFGGCLIESPLRTNLCEACELAWEPWSGDDADASVLSRGEAVESKGRRLTVTDLDLVFIPDMRRHLRALALADTTVTYGTLISDLRLPYVPNGLGRILDLLSEDCFRRGEPSLAALVVTRSTGEVGSAFDGDAMGERRLLAAYWRSRTT